MDKFKIIYKILKELEKNMGNEEFDIYLISAKNMKIPYEQLIILLADSGYISGIITSKSIQRHILEPIQPCITMRGLEYLSENSFMAKAKKALKMAGEII